MLKINISLPISRTLYGNCVESILKNYDVSEILEEKVVDDTIVYKKWEPLPAIKGLAQQRVSSYLSKSITERSNDAIGAILVIAARICAITYDTEQSVKFVIGNKHMEISSESFLNGLKTLNSYAVSYDLFYSLIDGTASDDEKCIPFEIGSGFKTINELL